MKKLTCPTWMTFLLVWLAATAMAGYIRCYPLWGHIWSSSHEQATMMVIYNIKDMLRQQIISQRPDIPPPQADIIATQKLNELMRTNKDRIHQAIEQANQTLTRQSGAKEPIFLLEADPFYFYNLTENIVQHGRMAETIKGNQYFNPLMGAPFGYWQPLSIHPYVGFLIYKCATLFSPSVPLMNAVAFTPILLTSLAILALLLAGRWAGLSTLPLLISSLFFAMAPVLLKRSSLGWYDTDPYNILFPFILFIFLFRTFQSQTRLNAFINGSILASALILYSLIWQGWIFLFYLTLIITATSIGYFLIICKNKNQAKMLVHFIVMLLAISTVLGVFIYGFSGYIQFFTEGSAELTKLTSKSLNLWPNLYMEVGELKRPSLVDTISNIGGWPFLILALTGATISWLFSVRHPQSPEVPRTLALSLFLLVSAVMTAKAERFVIFTLVPLSLFSGYFLEEIFRYLKRIRFGHYLVLILACGLIAWIWFSSQYNIRRVLTPIYNSTWHDAMTEIKIKTPADSIINTWWPPGHFIKAMAQRKVPFDGASLKEGATGYWIAHALLSTDSRYARGILRMINTSRNNAVDFLCTQGLLVSQAVQLIQSIAALDKTSASLLLNTHSPLSPKTIDLLLNMTHGSNPHSYLLIYNEMVDSIDGLTFTGTRNFSKIEEINNNPSLLSAVPSPDSPGFIDFLWQLSGGPKRFSPNIDLINQDQQSLYFNEGLVISRDMATAHIQSAQYGKGVPLAIMYMDHGRVVQKQLPNPTLNYMIVLYTRDNKPVCRLMETSLANSLLVRLYFFDGTGIDDFKLLKSSRDLTGRTEIKTFEVIW